MCISNSCPRPCLVELWKNSSQAGTSNNNTTTSLTTAGIDESNNLMENNTSNRNHLGNSGSIALSDIKNNDTNDIEYRGTSTQHDDINDYEIVEESNLDDVNEEIVEAPPSHTAYSYTMKWVGDLQNIFELEVGKCTYLVNYSSIIMISDAWCMCIR